MMLLIVSSIIYMCWLTDISPLKSRKHFRLEVINELLLLALCYHMLCFTDLTDIVSQLETVQPSFQSITVLIVMINMVSLIYDTVCRDKCTKFVEDKVLKRKQNLDTLKKIKAVEGVDEEKDPGSSNLKGRGKAAGRGSEKKKDGLENK